MLLFLKAVHYISFKKTIHTKFNVVAKTGLWNSKNIFFGKTSKIQIIFSLVNGNIIFISYFDKCIPVV